MSMTPVEWFEARAKNTPMPGTRKMFEIAAAALREKAEREDPKPLTYAELLKMHGEPVYVTVPGKPHRSKWCIVEACCPQPGLHGLDYFCDLLIVGTNAIKVYRHKPKEVTHE